MANGDAAVGEPAIHSQRGRMVAGIGGTTDREHRQESLFILPLADLDEHFLKSLPALLGNEDPEAFPAPWRKQSSPRMLSLTRLSVLRRR